MKTRLKAPTKYLSGANIWVGEAIWGYRLFHGQTPWLALLEFLAIFQSRRKAGKALKESRINGENESFIYHIPRLIPLRQLIFNDPHIRYVEDTQQSDSGRWRLWLKSSSAYDDFGYLKDRFESFARLARVVEFFQTTAIESHRRRRWTSRFLFPYGPNCLYAELRADVYGRPGSFSFAGGGELLYLMLNRSGMGHALADTISQKLLRRDGTWNLAARALLPEGFRADANMVSKTIGYLPFADREEYGELAKTWMRLLNLDLPGEVLLDPLMRLSILHMLLYMLRRANEETGDHSEPKFVFEIASPKRTSLLELSMDNLKANRVLSTRAVRAYVEAAKNDERWQAALDSREPAAAAREYLVERYKWKHDGGLPSGGPEAIFDALLGYAEKRHQGNVARIHMVWAGQIGLLVSRRGVGSWYSPDDFLLKALVMCVVDEEREEYYRFLGKLYDRFRIVVGVSEAERAFGSLPTDQNTFIQNTQRLEQRLRTLGLLIRLSDDCAYVENPFGKRL